MQTLAASTSSSSRAISLTLLSLSLSLSPSTELPHPHTNFSVPNKVPPALFFSLELFFSIPALLSSLSF